jgi:hypothetical protein
VQVVHVRLLRTAAVLHEEWDGVPVVRVPFHPARPRTLVSAYREVRRLVRRADIVHTMAFSTALVLAPLRRSRPWLHTEHWNGVLTPEQNGPVWRRLAGSRRILRVPDRVTGVSTMMCDVLRRFAPADRVERIGNVVDHAEQVATPPRGSTLELVAVGALRDIKDPLLAVDTVAWQRDAGHDVPGQDPAVGRGERHLLLGQQREQPRDHRLVFLDGPHAIILPGPG